MARTTFSGAFETGAIYDLSTSSVIFNVFMNIALYLVFTVLCFYMARPPQYLADLLNPYLLESRLTQRLPQPIKRVIGVKRMSRVQTIAVCFCGAAKTTSLGIPLVTAMWKDADSLTRAYIQIPVLLYTIEQVTFLPNYEFSMVIYLTVVRSSWRSSLCISSDGILREGERRIQRCMAIVVGTRSRVGLSRRMKCSESRVSGLGLEVS